jgi:hypothetical protein
MPQAIDWIRTAALTRMPDDGRRARRRAASPSYVSVRFIFLCGAIVLVLAFPGGKAGAEPIGLAVADASASFNPSGEGPIVNVRFTPSSGRLFAVFTSRNVGKLIEVRLDGSVLMKARLQTPIYGGIVVICCQSNIAEAKDIASRLSGGAGRLEVEAAAQ